MRNDRFFKADIVEDCTDVFATRYGGYQEPDCATGPLGFYQMVVVRWGGGGGG